MKTPRWTSAATLRSLIVCLFILIVAGCSKQPAAQPITQPTTQSQPSPDITKDAPETDSDDKLAITVSILPQQYFVERVGGEHVAVNVMVPPGEFPGTYEPKPDQLTALSEADAYISIDVPFERAWLERFQQANSDMLMVDTTQGIERRGPADQPDPHIWLSPLLVKKQARTIADALIELDPNHTEEYEDNLAAFTSDIDTLYKETATALKDLKTRKFMVFHPAWGYFAQDYNLEMIPIEVGGQEPSATELAEVVQHARDNNIKVIFAQPQFDPKSAHTLADEIGGEVVLIDPLAPDWLANQQRVSSTFVQVLGGTDDEQTTPTIGSLNDE